MRAYLQDLEKKHQADLDQKPMVRSRYKWIVIATDLFPGEEILGVMDERYLEEAQRENPGLVTYLLSEIDILQPCRNDTDTLKKIHMIKKEFGGWIKQ